MSKLNPVKLIKYTEEYSVCHHETQAAADGLRILAHIIATRHGIKQQQGQVISPTNSPAGYSGAKRDKENTPNNHIGTESARGKT